MAVAGISEQGRDATGVTVMSLGKNELVAAISPAPAEDPDLRDGDDADGDGVEVDLEAAGTESTSEPSPDGSPAAENTNGSVGDDDNAPPADAGGDEEE